MFSPVIGLHLLPLGVQALLNEEGELLRVLHHRVLEIAGFALVKLSLLQRKEKFHFVVFKK